MKNENSKKQEEQLSEEELKKVNGGFLGKIKSQSKGNGAEAIIW